MGCRMGKSFDFLNKPCSLVQQRTKNMLGNVGI